MGCQGRASHIIGSEPGAPTSICKQDSRFARTAMAQAERMHE